MISSPDASQNPLSITVNLLNDLFSLIWTETIFMRLQTEGWHQVNSFKRFTFANYPMAGN